MDYDSTAAVITYRENALQTEAITENPNCVLHDISHFEPVKKCALKVTRELSIIV